MICYMPFTVMTEQQYRMLTDTVEHLTVYSPANALVPDRMRNWSREGKLEIRHSQAVDEQQLIQAIGHYKTWADLHQGGISDMAGFFKSQQGRIPMMDDTNPTQIGHQVRHYGESAQDKSEDRLHMAALFLGMAQEYDEQQQGMARELDAVHAMEQKMIRQLSGGILDGEGDMAVGTPSAPSHGRRIADDPFMIAQRIQAWARLALEAPPAPSLFLTLNQTAADQMLDMFPEAVQVAAHASALSLIQRDLDTLAFESDPRTLELMPDDSAGSCPDDLQWTIYLLAGISPALFLSRLADLAPVEPVGSMPVNTFIAVGAKGG